MAKAARVLILHPLQYGHPSGMPALVTQLVAGFLATGAEVTLIVPKACTGLGLDQTAFEVYDCPRGDLRVQWWPNGDFRRNGRQMLLHRLEGELSRSTYHRVLAIGVEGAGYVASIASRLTHTPLSVLVNYRDAFEHHLDCPHEVDLVHSTADHILSPNHTIASHLSSFYETDRTLLVDTELTPEIDALCPPDDCCKWICELTDGCPYVVTTGLLSSLTDNRELIDLVSRLIRDGIVQRWVHAGHIDQDILVPMFGRLALTNLLESFVVTGTIISRIRYAALVKQAEMMVRPRGEVNTALAAKEANHWSIPLSVPAGFPVEPVKHPEACPAVRGRNEAKPSSQVVSRAVEIAGAILQ